MQSEQIELPDRCHGCGRPNNPEGGWLYERVDDESDADSTYVLCRECGVGVRVSHPNGEVVVGYE